VDGASISTAAASANGGNISLAVGGLFYLQQGAVTTSVSGQSGNGGNITIGAARAVLADGSQIVAQAVLGHGGNIAIDTGAFVPEVSSVVSATSQLGISGTVTITGEETGLDSGLVVLPGNLRAPEAILRSSCAVRDLRPRSSLTEGGRGGLPASPNATLPSLYVASQPPAAPTGALPSRALPPSFTPPLPSPCG
jgi:hypothetical protein